MNESSTDVYMETLNTLPFASSHYIIPSTVLIYLYIVLHAGPKYMKQNNPIRWLKTIIPFYNAIQVMANLLLVVWAFNDPNFIYNTLHNLCGFKEQNQQYQIKFAYLAYFWCLLKISDFLDTIFFIAAKKNSHVSFLHVYHHTTTMFVAFIVYRYIRIEQTAIYAAVNSCVHVTMYSYYFLTSIGLKPKWKKIVTIIQLIQFVALMIMTCVLLTCQVKPHYLYFSIYSLCQCIMYIYLFGKFYKQNYTKKIE